MLDRFVNSAPVPGNPNRKGDPLDRFDRAPYPTWLNPGDNAWQLTAATLVGLMSVPGLVVLYGGVMQKRWSVNSMMLAFTAFAAVLIVWVLYAFDMGFGNPWHGFVRQRRRPASSGTSSASRARCSTTAKEQGQANIPLVGGPPWHFPQSSLVYFQFVFAAITPLLMLGSVLGRINFKAWLISSRSGSPASTSSTRS